MNENLYEPDGNASNAAGSREWALRISDRLVTAGKTHAVTVGVHDGHIPRERYSVTITPALTYSATDITELQNLAAELGCRIAYCNGSFTFTGRGDA